MLLFRWEYLSRGTNKQCFSIPHCHLYYCELFFILCLFKICLCIFGNKPIWLWLWLRKYGLCMYSTAYDCHNGNDATQKIWVNTLHGQAMVIQPITRLIYRQSVCIFCWLYYVKNLDECNYACYNAYKRIVTNIYIYIYKYICKTIHLTTPNQSRAKLNAYFMWYIIHVHIDIGCRTSVVPYIRLRGVDSTLWLDRSG